MLKPILQADEKISLKISSTISPLVSNKIFSIIYLTGNQFAFPLVLLCIFFLFEVTFYELLYMTILAVSVTLLLMVLKSVVKRKRPLSEDEKKVVFYFDQFSFPSGQATRIGALLMFLLLYYSQPWYSIVIISVWAFIICLSRVVRLQHYASDVVIGFLIGMSTLLVLFNLPTFFGKELIEFLWSFR